MVDMLFGDFNFLIIKIFINGYLDIFTPDHKYNNKYNKTLIFIKS